MNYFEWDAIVIGAGAAGLMCAAVAAQRGRRVLVVDHGEPGRKILISGGGRCNFTNIGTGPRQFVGQNRHFHKSALARYKPTDVMAFLARHGLSWHEKTLGQLFCDQKAPAVLQALLDECKSHGVRFRFGVPVEEVIPADGGFAVTVDGAKLSTAGVVVASGGLSIPNMGATPFGYKVAERLNIPIVSPRAGLVPLRLNNKDLDTWGELAGLSTPVKVRVGKVAFEESMLFTHRGLSGPAILQISNYWHPGDPVVIDLLPGLDAAVWLLESKAKRPKLAMYSLLGQKFAKRLAATLCGHLNVDRPLGELSDKALRRAAEGLKNWTVTPESSEGYRTAEVTLGGVDTAALSSQTMAAKAVPGLYFIGEVVDVTGWLGGYNFQWAWASANAAGEAI